MESQYRGYTIHTSSLPMLGGLYRSAASVTPVDPCLPKISHLIRAMDDSGFATEDLAHEFAILGANASIDVLWNKVVTSLHGKIFALLTPEELAIFDFIRTQGRKYGVIFSIENKVDPTALASAKSVAEADAILKSANSIVHVSFA